MVSGSASNTCHLYIKACLSVRVPAALLMASSPKASWLLLQALLGHPLSMIGTHTAHALLKRLSLQWY